MVDLVNFFNIKFRNGNTMGCHIGAVMFDQYWLFIVPIHSHLPCLGIYITHHTMKPSTATLLDVTESLDVTVVHIKVCVCWEVTGLMAARLPLVDAGIELTICVSTKWPHKKNSLTAVATNATIVAGTSRTSTPSVPWDVGKRKLYRWANALKPPVKQRSRITAMIREFW